MEISIEATPVVAGVLVGLACSQLVPRRLRGPAAVVLAAPLGALVSWAAGELHVSVAFVVFDAGQVALAALATLAVTGLGARRRRGVRRG